MRVAVVGSGVMGLAAARVLAERGHDVTAVDRFGVGNRTSSSSGATRIWRLAHPDRPMVRLARRTVEAWRDLERRSGRTLLLENGLLWRGPDAPAVLAALEAEGVAASWVDAAQQGHTFPELRPVVDRPVVWQPEAGVLMAAEGLAVQQELLERAGGVALVGETVVGVETGPTGMRVVSDRGRHDADVVVLTAGPWSPQLLPAVGVDLALEPVLEQVSYFSGPGAWATRPAVVEGFGTDGFGPEGSGAEGALFYGLPTPGVGYKVGIDRPLRRLAADDLDRTPSAERVAETEALVAQVLPGLDPTARHSEVCAWTSSPDEGLVLDRVGDVVIGCGDSGQAFKFSPLIGEILADLAEGHRVDDDVARLGLARFGARREPPPSGRTPWLG